MTKHEPWTPHSLCEVPDRAEHICLAVDRNGKKYTEHVFSDGSKPWSGATILSRSLANRLEADGLLPLTEITS